MTVLYIILAILLLIFLLLMPYVKIIFKHIGDETLLEIKYLFVTFSPLVKDEPKPKKERKTKKRKTDKSAKEEPKNEAKNDEKSAEEEQTSADCSEEKSDTNDKEKRNKPKSDNLIKKIKDNWEFIVATISSAGKMLRKILSKIYIYDFMIDFTIAGEDAYEAAINYGKMNIAVYNGISFLRMFFDTKIKTVDISCDFDGKESRYDCEASARVRVITIVAAAIVFAVEVLRAKNAEAALNRKKKRKKPVRKSS